MRQPRVVVHIDEALCNGCGECVPSCAEGAIQIIDGKARLMGENLCDGLGACLGHCPQGAITLEERPAAEFDERAVEAHLSRLQRIGGGCPGLREIDLGQPYAPDSPAAAPAPAREATPARGLNNFPVQLHLVNPQAAAFRGADLLIAADCVAFAMPAFHTELVGSRAVVIGCPKLDDVAAYVEKLTELFTAAAPRSITVARMEVPCCGGLTQIVRHAAQLAGLDVPIVVRVIGAEGAMR